MTETQLSSSVLLMSASSLVAVVVDNGELICKQIEMKKTLSENEGELIRE
jgi:hypothetical protein